MTFITIADTGRETLDPARRRPVRPLHVAAAVIVLGLIGGAIGWTLGSTRSAGYTSVASVVINPLPGNPFHDESLAPIETLETEAQRPRSDAVIDEVVKQMEGALDPTVLRRRVTVGVAPRSEVIEVTYRGGSAPTSAQIAEALAQATLDDRQRRAADVAEQQVSEIRSVLRATRTKLETSSDPAEQQLLSRRKILLGKQLRELEDQPVRPGTLIGVTTEPRSNLKVQGVVGLSGLVVGAIVGLSIGRWLSRRSRRPT